MSNIEEHNITDNMPLYGYITKEAVPITDAFVDYMVELYKLGNEKHTMCKPNRNSLNEVIEHAKDFFQKVGIDIHNVGLCTDEDLAAQLNDETIKSINQIVDSYNRKGKSVSPFDIPVVLEDTHCFISKTVEQTNILRELKNNKELLNILCVYFKSINLPKTTGDIVTADYVHEITNTQLKDEKGSVEDYYNSEVLGIFNELLYAYNIDNEQNLDNGLLNIMLTNRINNAFTAFTRLYQKKGERLFQREYGIYTYSGSNRQEKTSNDYNEMDTDYLNVISTIKALKLFSIYVSDNSKSKNILDQINDIINGIQPLESMLNSLDITTSNSMDIGYAKSLYNNK